MLVLAACGGGSGGSSSDPKAQITSAYQNFFSPKTNVDQKVALLQDGSKYKSVIQYFENYPGAKSVSVNVNSVTLQGASKAKVVYVIKLGSTSPLGSQIGSAVKQGGKWKVNAQSLCSLVELAGTAPPQCTK